MNCRRIPSLFVAVIVFAFGITALIGAMPEAIPWTTASIGSGGSRIEYNFGLLKFNKCTPDCKTLEYDSDVFSSTKCQVGGKACIGIIVLASIVILTVVYTLGHSKRCMVKTLMAGVVYLFAPGVWMETCLKDIKANHDALSGLTVEWRIGLYLAWLSTLLCGLAIALELFMPKSGKRGNRMDHWMDEDVDNDDDTFA